MNYLDILRTYDDMRDLNKQAFRMEQVYHFKLDPYIQYYDYDLCDEKSDDEYDSTAEGTNPYSASKAAAEEFCVAYENTYKMPMMITHTMNVFGERQTSEKFIPLCIDRVRKNEKIFIHSNAARTEAGSRFYIHAADVAEALLFLITKKPACPTDYGDAKCAKFNIVGKEEVDNLTLAKLVAQAQDKELIYEMLDFHNSRPGHDLRYALDGTLMRNLGWEPKIAFSERIKQVSDWYLENTRWL